MLAVLVLSFGLAGCGSTAKEPFDIRGTWDMIAIAGTSQYPQTMQITSEDFTTGAVAGTDVGAGLSFTVVGRVSGSDVTFTTANAGYTSHSKGTVGPIGSTMLPGNTLRMSGTFTDSNQTSGTFSALRTGP
jgi:hypothetical protein